MGYGYNCSASNMFVTNKVLSFKECMKKSMYTLLNRLKDSDNNSDKYNRHLVKDIEQKRVSYASIKDKSQAEQKEQ